MTDDDPQEGERVAAEANAEPPAAPAAPEPRLELTKGQWRERARSSFSASPHAIAGALHDRADDERLTEDQVRDALDQFSILEGLE